MLVDILAEQVLTGSGVGFYLGIPRSEKGIKDTSDQTGKTYLLPNPPAFPVSCNNIEVVKDDITAKVDGSSVTISSLKTDSEGYVTGVVLSEAPGSGKDVYLTYVEQLEPFIATSVEPDLSQDSKEIKPLNTDSQITSYGSISTKLKVKVVLTENGLEQFKALMFSPAESSPQGVNVYEMASQPKNLYAYTQFRVGDDVLARMYFKNVKVSPSLPGGEGGEQLETEFEMTVASTPILVEPSGT